jgi:hypothetical protein
VDTSFKDDVAAFLLLGDSYMISADLVCEVNIDYSHFSSVAEEN